MPGDADAVRAVHVAAFERDDEARLVAALRASARPYVGLVAVTGGDVVGHVAFSPVTRDEAFLVAELTPDAIRGRRGVVRYPAAFTAAGPGDAPVSR